jgi:large subunit ribosomal protein L17
LFLHQRIETTVMRAKEAQKMVDHIITFAKTGTLAARREAAKLIPDRTLLKVIFDSAPRYANRQGGYTRATVIGHRRGDAVKVVALELIQDEPTESAK